MVAITFYHRGEFTMRWGLASMIIGIPILIFLWAAITQPLLLVVCMLVTTAIWGVFGVFDDMDGEDK